MGCYNMLTIPSPSHTVLLLHIVGPEVPILICDVINECPLIVYAVLTITLDDDECSVFPSQGSFVVK